MCPSLYSCYAITATSRLARRWSLRLLVAAGLAAWPSACNQGTQTSPRASAEAGTGSGTGSSTLPLDAAIAGTLELGAAGDKGLAAGASVFLAGHPDVAVKADAQGQFVFTAGQIALATGASLGLAASSFSVVATVTTAGNAQYGLKQDQVIYVQGTPTQLGKLPMPWAGSIAGKITRYGQTDSTGIDVFLPGTSFAAKTAADGSFTMTGVPAGDWLVTAETAGFLSYTAPVVHVVSQSTASLGNIALGLDTGPQGQILPIGGGKILGSLTADVNLTYSANATLMMLSEDANFTGAVFIPVAPQITWNFTQPGQRTLYLKLADANGLESAPVSQTVLIEVTAPSQAQIVINGGATVTNKRLVTVALTAFDPAGVQDFQLAESPDFANAVWTPFAATTTWTLSIGEGAKTLYARFRNVLGYATGYNISASVLLDTTAPGSLSVAVAQGSYTNTQNITLNLLGTDTGSGMAAVLVGEVATLASVVPVAFASSLPFTLSATQGLHTIYVSFLDNAGNATPTMAVTTTLKTTPPTAVATLTATASSAACTGTGGAYNRSQIALSWATPAGAAGVKIMRRSDIYPTSPTDGVLVYNGAGTTTTQDYTTLSRASAYYYTAFSYDLAGNYATGAQAYAVAAANIACQIFPSPTATLDPAASSAATTGIQLAAYGSGTTTDIVVITTQASGTTRNVLVSSNGGQSFTKATQNLGAPIDVRTLDGTTFVALDIQNNAFYHTTTPGGTWTAATIPGTLTGNFKHMAWANATTGYIVGTRDGSNNPEILYTTNGGTTWTNQSINLSGTYVFSNVVATSPTTVWATVDSPTGFGAAQSYLCKFTGVPTSWTTSSCTQVALGFTDGRPYYYQTTYQDYRSALYASPSGNTLALMCATCNGGNSGYARLTNLSSPVITTLPFPDYNATGTYLNNLDTAFTLVSDAQAAFITADGSPLNNRLYTSTNFSSGTPTWGTPLLQFPEYNGNSSYMELADIAYTSTSRVYTIGAQAASGSLAALTSVDAGQTWTFVGGGSEVGMDAMGSNDSGTTFIAVGDDGAVMRSTNSGGTWDARLLGAAQGNALDALAVNLSPSVFAGGYAGTLLASTNAGSSWTALGTLPSTFNISGLATPSGSGAGISMVAVASNSPNIYYSSTSGSSWAAPFVAPNAPTGLSAVKFVTATTGFICGTGGTILKTNDGGQTWFSIADTFSTAFDDLSFVDGETGWVVGAGGVIVHTTDGGQTWVQQSVPSIGNVLKVSFADANVGWVAVDDYITGNLDKIYETHNGGQDWIATNQVALGNGNAHAINALVAFKTATGYQAWLSDAFAEMRELLLNL